MSVLLSPPLEKTDGIFLLFPANLALVRGEKPYKVPHRGFVALNALSRNPQLQMNVQGNIFCFSALTGSLLMWIAVQLTRLYVKTKAFDHSYHIIRGELTGARWRRIIWNIYNPKFPEIQYRFINPHGQQITTPFTTIYSLRTPHPFDYEFQLPSLPPSGTPVAVLYHSDTNYQLL